MSYSFSTSPTPAFDPFVLVCQAGVTPDPVLSQTATANETTINTNYNDGDFSTNLQVVGKVEDPLTISPEDETIKTTDGSDIVTSEGISLEFMDLNFTKANYEQMRTDLHKSSCDIYLVDPAQNTFAVKLSGLVLKVAPDIGEMKKIKITGTKSSSDLDNIFSIVTLS